MYGYHGVERASRKMFARPQDDALVNPRRHTARPAMKTDRFKHISIEHRLDIHDLLARYAWSLDLKSSADIASLFAQAGTLDVSGERIQGTALIREYFEAQFTHADMSESQHHVGTIWIEPCGWDCLVRSYAFETRHLSAEGRPELIASGYFEDTIVREAGELKFGERKYRAWRAETIPHSTARLVP